MAASADLVSAKFCSDLNDGKIVASDAGTTIATFGTSSFRQYVYELGRAVLQGNLKPAKFAVGIKAVKHQHETAGNEIADAFWFLWLEAEETKKHKMLVLMVKDAMNAGLVSQRCLMETGEVDFLKEAGLVNDAKMWRDKEIRINTRTIYLQSKYNLLREESEGYAKMITALNGHGKMGITTDTVPALTKYLQCLIGYFDLDPNRVFDAILEAYEHQPDNRAYLELLPNFTYKNTTCLIGFKLAWHQKPSSESPTPLPLLLVAASLMKSGYVEMDGIYAYLSPLDEDLVAASKQASEVLESKEIKPPEQPVPDVTNASRQKPTNGSAAAPSPLQQGHRAVNHRMKLAADSMPQHNQKLMLLQGLLEVGHWDGVHQLASRLEEMGLRVAADEGVASALCMALRRLVGPEYAKLKAFVPLSKRGKAKLKADLPGTARLPEEAAKLLCLLGPYLHKDRHLFTQILRVLQSQVAGFARSRGDAQAAMSEVAQVSSSSLLPALELIPFNPSLAEDVWGILRDFPYTLRFQVYATVAAGFQEHPILSMTANQSLETAREVVSQCSAPISADRSRSSKGEREDKEKVKKFARTLAKISHASPMAAATAILEHLEKAPSSSCLDPAPPGMEQILRVLGFMTRLGLDIFCWSLLRRLAVAQESALLADGQMAPWAAALASMAGHLCKRFSAVELAPFLRLCLGAASNAIKGQPDNEGSSKLPQPVFHELLVLQRLLEGLAEARQLDDLTVDQVDVEASGVLLRRSAQFRQVYTTPKTLRAVQRSTTRLTDVLQGKDHGEPLAKALLIDLALAWTFMQRQNRSLKGQEEKHRRALSGAVDRCRAALLHYSAFLVESLGSEGYAKLLPSMIDMHAMGLQPELVFHLWRPCLAFQEGKEDSDDEGETGAASQAAQLRDMVADAVQKMVPRAHWQSISPSLYTTFWTLKLGDIHSADARYKSAVKSLEDDARSLQPSRGSHSEANVKRSEADKLKELASKLPAELEARRLHVRQVGRRLQVDKDAFLTEVTDHKRTSEIFLQSCLFPRCRLSPEDAIYCSRFVDKLNRMKTPYFNMVLFYDQSFKNTINLLHCCSPQEVSNIGMFLAQILSVVEKYRADAKLYANECASSPCFLAGFTSLKGEPFSHEKFKKLCQKWHSLLCRNFLDMFNSGKPGLVENSLTLLRKLVRVPFPAIRPAYLKLKTELRKDVKSHSPAIKALIAACLVELDQLDSSSLVPDVPSYSGSQVPSRPPAASAGAGASSGDKAAAPAAAAAAAADRNGGGSGAASHQRSREVSPNRREAYGRERGGRRERDRDHSPQGVRPTPPPKPSTPVRETQDLVPPRVRDLDDSSPSRARRPSPIHPSAGSPAQGVPRESQQHRQSALRPDAEPFVPSCAEPPSKRHRDPEPPETAKRAKKVVEAIPVGDVEETEEGAKSTISIATKGIKRKDRMKDKEREKWRDGRSKDKGREAREEAPHGQDGVVSHAELSLPPGLENLPSTKRRRADQTQAPVVKSEQQGQPAGGGVAHRGSGSGGRRRH